MGFIGDDYEAWRILVLGINPGNGQRNFRSGSDSRMIPLLHAFAAQPDEQTYKVAMKAQMEAFPSWPASQELWPLIEGEGIALSEIAYVNANPYRADNVSEP